MNLHFGLTLGHGLRASVSVSALSAYAANSLTPPLVLDFEAGTHGKDSEAVTGASDVLTWDRTGLATMTDSSGTPVWAPHNLALNSASPATQSITVTSSADYTVAIAGSGSVALSGAGTGTVTDGSPVEVTAATATLTLTVTGSPDQMYCYRSDLGGMAQVPASERDVADLPYYVATTGAAKYLRRQENYRWDGAGWNGPRALTEPAGVNYIEYSHDFSNAYWNQAAITDTGFTTTAPDGSTVPWYEIESNTDGNFQVNTGIAAGQAAVNSIWIKANKAAVIGFRIPGSSDYEDISLTTEWQRFSASTASTGDSDGRFIVENRATKGYGVANLEIALWGAQQEVGTQYPTSLIPTAGAQGARTADEPVIAAANVPYSATGMSFAVRGLVTYADNNDANELYIWRYRKNSTNRIRLVLTTNSSKTGTARISARGNGSGEESTEGEDHYSPGQNVPISTAAYVTVDARNVASDGTAATEDANNTWPSDLSATDIELFPGAVAQIERIVIWDASIGATGLEEASATS